MGLGVSDVRETVERVCARPDVLDACRNRDLGFVIEVLGGHGVTQGRIAGLTSISQGRLSEYKQHKITPKAASIFQAFADGLGMPPAARQALGLDPDQPVTAGNITQWDTLPNGGANRPGCDRVGVVYGIQVQPRPANSDCSGPYQLGRRTSRLASYYQGFPWSIASSRASQAMETSSWTAWGFFPG
jgi:hypothetical protein